MKLYCIYREGSLTLVAHKHTQVHVCPRFLVLEALFYFERKKIT